MAEVEPHWQSREKRWSFEEGPPLRFLEESGTLSDFHRRESRSPDYESESRALSTLIQGIADRRHDVLQCLVDETLQLTRADSAGISVLEREEAGRQVFRWRAAAGRWSRFRGQTIPREASPCGFVLERDQTLVMEHPERFFRYEGEDVPPIAETLLVPFRVAGRVVGTLWSILHDEERKFDPEDERLLQNLAGCAGACLQLSQSADAAEETVRSKSKFLARISHEIRNPLHTIQGYLDLLLDGILGPLTAHQHRALERTRRTASHLNCMIEEILLFARAGGGDEPLDVDDIDMTELVYDIAEIHRGDAERKNIAIDIVADEGVIATSDEGKLRHILMNLIGNAVKYTETGRVRVEVDASPRAVELRVDDSGPGIAPDRLDEIFEPFKRGDDRGEKGTGLGLAIVRRFARALGGDARVESELGEGSTFIVTIERRLQPEEQAVEQTGPR